MIDLTPALRLYARRRRAALAREDAAAAQAEQLRRLLARAQDTRFGRDHGFARLATVGEFQRAVRLRSYETMWSEYWRESFPNLVDVSWPGRIRWFATTSGTTSGASKYIPVSGEMNRSNLRAAFDVLVHHLAHRPGSRVLGGKNFMLGSSAALVERAPGVYSGDLSGIAVKRLPRLFRPLAFPPSRATLEPDWEKRLEEIVRLAPAADIRAISGTPAWLLLLFDRQQRAAGRALTARTLYPKLELLVHGGVNFKPYRERFEAFLDGGAELREVYPASEGFIAVQDGAPEDGLRLLTDNGLFFEFVPVGELGRANPTRHTLANAEMGVNYAIAVSSCAGLWAYLIGDTVRFVSRAPPRILVTGRTSYFMSAFGEHLIGEEIEDAVTVAAKAIAAAVTDFAMSAVFPARAGETGRHCYAVEFAHLPSKPEMISSFARALDERLCRLNEDYSHYRKESRIGPPEIAPAPPGAFAAWMKARGRLGGQNKVPRVVNDPALFAQLRAFVCAFSAGS